MSAFFNWISTLPSLVQIPLVILAFGVVCALVIFFIEIAPRSGRMYMIIRLAVCIVVPLAIVLALGSIWWAAAAAAVLGGLFFILDYRSKQGAGYLVQLIGFLSPAVLLLGIGLIYPTISTAIAAFLNSRGNRFVGL